MNNFTIFINPNCYLSIYTEIFLISIILVIITFFVIIDFFFKYKIILTYLNAKITMFSIFWLFLIELNSNYSNFIIFNNLFLSNSFTNFIKLVVFIIVLACIVLSLDYIKYEKIANFEYFILLLLALLGTITLVSSNNLISMYLGIELQSLSFYILASYKTHNNFSTEAGLKYFILGAFSSGLLLFGSSIIYGFTGMTNFNDFSLLFLSQEIDTKIFNILVIGILFVTVGMLFKLGAVPFHMWLPDVYEGSPTIVTLVFAILPKIAIFSVFINFSLSLSTKIFFFWNEFIIYTALASLLLGTFAALYQIKLKRLIAYSAITHMGYMLISFSMLNIDSLFAVFFYLIVYILISIGIFGIILSLRKFDNNLKIKNLSEIVILTKNNFVLAILFSILLFSVAGIPPLIGFYSKLYVFIAALKYKLYFITIFASIISVIASMYYIRLIKLMFFKIHPYWIFLNNIIKSNALLISYSVLLNFLFFFYPSLIVTFLYNIVLEFIF